MLEASVIFAAGVWAGTINVIVGSGTLITFPTLLLFGYAPITANVSNNIGLVAGGLSGIHGYRAEALRHRSLLLRLAPASAAGALTGALLLLVLPAEAFKTVVPVLILLGLVMVVAGPAMQRRTARRHAQLGSAPPASRWTLPAGIYLLGTYGGYFGAAAGIIMLAANSLQADEPLAITNAVKNLATGAANGVAALAYMVFGDVDWAAALALAIGCGLGGWIGPGVVRFMPERPLRVAIALAGLGLATYLWTQA